MKKLRQEAAYSLASYRVENRRERFTQAGILSILFEKTGQSISQHLNAQIEKKGNAMEMMQNNLDRMMAGSGFNYDDLAKETDEVEHWMESLLPPEPNDDSGEKFIPVPFDEKARANLALHHDIRRVWRNYNETKASRELYQMISRNLDPNKVYSLNLGDLELLEF